MPVSLVFAAAGGGSGKYQVTLRNPVGSVLVEGQDNLIRWRGGKKVVQVGVIDQNGDPLGWITVDGRPNGKLYWNTKKVCDLAMTVCWNTRDLVGQYGTFKLVVVSEDAQGNFLMSDGGNYDESDDYFGISSKSNMPATEVPQNAVRYSASELLKRIENVLGKKSKEYKTVKSLIDEGII